MIVAASAKLRPKHLTAHNVDRFRICWIILCHDVDNAFVFIEANGRWCCESNEVIECWLYCNIN